MIDTKLVYERYVRLRDQYHARNTQISRWRKMYFLDWGIEGPLDQDEDFEFVIDNLPHEKCELAIDTLTSNEPIVEIPVIETPQGDSGMADDKRMRLIKKRKSEAEWMERFLTGYWERLEGETQTNIWRQMVIDLVVTGYAVARVLWDDEREEDHLPVLVQHIKPETFYALEGRRGHLAVCCAWKRTKQEVEDEWGIRLTPIPGNEDADPTTITVEFVDWWEKEKDDDGKVTIWHCCYADDQLLFNPKKTSYRDLPYIQVMAKPTESEDVANEALPFIFGYKDLWDTSNKHLSDFRNLLRYYAAPAKIIKVAGGVKRPDVEIGLGTTSYLDSTQDEDAKFLQWEGTPPDFHRFTNQLQMMADRVGFNTQYLSGNTGNTESGWHWTQATSTQRLKLRPYKRAAEWMRQEVNRHILRRLEEHASEVGKVMVYGTDRAETRYTVELDCRKIKGQYINLVRINDHIPYDEIEKAQLIRTYREPVNGTPFLSDDFLRQTIAQVPYNEEVKQQIADQQLAFHEQMLEFMVERAMAQQMIKLQAEQPTEAAALRDIQSQRRPPPPLPPGMMGQGGMMPPGIMPQGMPPPNMPPGAPAPPGQGGMAALMQNTPNMPPGIGLVPPPGGMPMAPAAPPVAMGQTVAPGPPPGMPPPLPPDLMRRFRR